MIELNSNYIILYIVSNYQLSQIIRTFLEHEFVFREHYLPNDIQITFSQLTFK